MKRVITASANTEISASIRSNLQDEWCDILDEIIEDAKDEFDWHYTDQEILDSIINDIVYSDYYWGEMPKSLAYYIQENPKVIESYIIDYLK